MGGPGSGGQNQYWTDELIEQQLREMAAALNGFPTCSELRELGRNDLACVVSKRGGFLLWANRLGMIRKPSDSDTGWEGEIAFCKLCGQEGICVERMPGVKAPYDVLVSDVLKVDIKTARFAEYRSKRNRSCGWFYRVGKRPQADLILLYQLDTGDFYGLPWWLSPTKNITISQSGGKWSDYRNNWPLIRKMIGVRQAERAMLGTKVAEVA